MQTKNTEPVEITLPPSDEFPRQLHVRRDRFSVRAVVTASSTYMPIASALDTPEECVILLGAHDLLAVGGAKFWITKPESEQLIALFGFPVRS